MPTAQQSLATAATEEAQKSRKCPQLRKKVSWGNVGTKLKNEIVPLQNPRCPPGAPPVTQGSQCRSICPPRGRAVGGPPTKPVADHPPHPFPALSQTLPRRDGELTAPVTRLGISSGQESGNRSSGVMSAARVTKSAENAWKCANVRYSLLGHSCARANTHPSGPGCRPPWHLPSRRLVGSERLACENCTAEQPQHMPTPVDTPNEKNQIGEACQYIDALGAENQHKQDVSSILFREDSPGHFQQGNGWGDCSIGHSVHTAAARKHGAL